MDLDNIKIAILCGNIQLINEFINDKAVLDKFVNGSPHEFYEILSSAISVYRTDLSLDNIDEIYDDLILKLIKQAKEVHFGLFDGTTLLISALENLMSYKIIDQLIKAGSDVNTILNDTIMTPLMYALDAGNEKNIIARLINGGADIDHRNEDGWTPLFYGIFKYCWYPDLITMLLNAGSNVGNLDKEGKNVLMVNDCYCIDGSYCKAKESIDVLLKYGISDVDLKHTDNEGDTILHLTNCKYVFDLAVKSGVSMEAKNNKGQTPLVKVSSQYYEEKLVYLLKSGANIRSTDSELQTALHSCILNVKEFQILNDPVFSSIIDMLIYHGGDMFARNIYDQTPLDMIIEKEDYYIEVAFVFLKHIIPFDVNEFSFEKKTLYILYRRSEVRSFIVSCKLELSLMQEIFIADGVTFYEFCFSKLYYKSKCVNISRNEYKYSYSEIRKLFPIYGNVIIIRLKDNRLKKYKLDLCRKFEKITLRSTDSMKSDFGVDLNYDCLYHISQYLNYDEILDIFSAATEI